MTIELDREVLLKPFPAIDPVAQVKLRRIKKQWARGLFLGCTLVTGGLVFFLLLGATDLGAVKTFFLSMVIAWTCYYCNMWCYVILQRRLARQALAIELRGYTFILQDEAHHQAALLLGTQLLLIQRYLLDENLREEAYHRHFWALKALWAIEEGCDSEAEKAHWERRYRESSQRLRELVEVTYDSHSDPKAAG